MYFSTHKFVGGVQAPGILVAKKKLFRNAYPTTGGGGTVFFVGIVCYRVWVFVWVYVCICVGVKLPVFWLLRKKVWWG